LVNYKIIGTDLKEYGPVSAEQIRQWITERRVDSETKLQAEGGGEWKRAADVPELAAAFPSTGPSTCPNCGEPFEDRLDSCWKCGTRRDGSRLKQWTPVEDAANGVAGQCPRCKSQRVVIGKLIVSGGTVVFQPGELRNFTFTLFGGVEPSVAPYGGCLDCGFLWGHIDQAKLEAFIRKHCTEETRKECGLSD
jgi:predicted Zn-ribbon and HTH transcriptional regulator